MRAAEVAPATTQATRIIRTIAYANAEERCPVTASDAMQHYSTACAQPMPPRRHRATPANPPRPPRPMPSLSLRQRRLRSSPQATWTRSRSVRGSGAAPSTAPTRRACSVQIRASTRTTGRAMCRLTATRETTPTAAGWRRLSLGRCPMRSADCRAGRRSRKCTCILPAARHSGHFAFQEYRCSSLLALGRPACASHPSRTTFLQRCRSRSQGLRREPWPRRHSAFGNVLAVRTHLPVLRPPLANDSAAETCGCGCGCGWGNRIAHTFLVRVHAVRQHRPIRTARRTPSCPITRRSPSHRRPMVRGRGLRSAIARGGSCAAGGAGAVDAIRVGCRRAVASNGLGGTLPPELGRLTDLVAL